MQVSPNGLLDKLGMSDMMSIQSQFMDSSAMTNDQVWLSLPESKKLRDDEYQLVEGKWPTNYNEVALEVDENNEITDYALYSLGLLDQDELVKNYQKILNGETDKISKTNLKLYLYGHFRVQSYLYLIIHILVFLLHLSLFYLLKSISTP